MSSFRTRILSAFTKSSQTTKCKSIRQVQCPIWFHQSIKLNLDLSHQDVIQLIKPRMEQFVKTGQSIQSLVVAIDITCQSELITAEIAEQLAQSILSALDQHYPDLRDRFVGISDDEQKLPLRDLMLTGKLVLEEIDNLHMFVFE